MATVDYSKELFQPLLLLHLALEEGQYHNDLVPWEQRKEQLRAQYEDMSARHWGRLQRAAALLEKVELGEDLDANIRTIYHAGVLRYDNKEYAESGDLFFLLVNLAPGNGNCWTLLGMNEQQQGHYEEAITAYEQAILLNTSHCYPDLYIAQCLTHLDRDDEASEQVNRLLADKMLIEAKPVLHNGLLSLQRLLLEKRSYEYHR